MRETLVATSNEALVPTLLLLGALVVPVAFLTLIVGRGLKVTVSRELVAVVGLAGGVIGVVIAGLVEFESLQRLGTTGKVGVAITEEVAKLIVPAAVLLLRRPRRVTDGLILGVAGGAGFAALETMGYAFTTIVHDHGDLTTVSNLLMVRGLWSPAGHMAWTGITAAALYNAADQRFSRRTAGVLIATFGLAVALHTAWDTIATPWAYAAIAIVGLGSLAAVVHAQTPALVDRLAPGRTGRREMAISSGRPT